MQILYVLRPVSLCHIVIYGCSRQTAESVSAAVEMIFDQSLLADMFVSLHEVSLPLLLVLTF